jgi:uncharacterized membrane protein YbhN (UPF0104 family)
MGDDYRGGSHGQGYGAAFRTVRPGGVVTRAVVWAWVRVLGGAGILAVLLWRLGAGGFLDGLGVMNGATLLAALGIGLLTTVLSAWRWCLVARGLGVTLPLRVAVADYYRALFLNAALPGGVLGDVHRAVRHGQGVGNVGLGVRAVVLERCAGQVVLVAVGVAVLFAHPSAILPQVHLGAIPVAAAATGGLALALVVGIRLRRGASRCGRVVRAAVSDVRLGLLARGNWRGIAMSSALVLVGHLAMFLLAARAAGSSAPAARLLPLMVLALLAMALPVNVGGWGPREGFCAWAFAAAGLGATQGLAIAVGYGLLALVASLPGAGVLIVRSLVRLRPALPQPGPGMPRVVPDVVRPDPDVPRIGPGARRPVGAGLARRRAAAPV